jgi:hypothetical protein
VEEEVGAKREEHQGQKRLGLVGRALAHRVGHGCEQTGVEEGFDRQPEEGAAADGISAVLLHDGASAGGGWAYSR